MKNSKKASSRKATGRTIPLYPRVTIQNSEWVKSMKASCGAATSEAQLVDKLLSHCRKSFGVKEIKEIVNGRAKA